MKPVFALALAAFLPSDALAQGIAMAATDTVEEAEEVSETVAQVRSVAEEMAAEGLEGLEVLDAAQADLDSFLWVKRPIIIFANTPADPAFDRQIRDIVERAEEFAIRDVVLIVDADPAAQSDARRRLRPRGFMLAILDKDGEVKHRRPAPRTAREIMAVIDRFPARRQEMLEQRPSGRE